MFRTAKLVVEHAKMFVWMLHHEIHSGEGKSVMVDYVEDDKTITTMCRCVHCGGTFEFSSNKPKV